MSSSSAAAESTEAVRTKLRQLWWAAMGGAGECDPQRFFPDEDGWVLVLEDLEARKLARFRAAADAHAAWEASPEGGAEEEEGCAWEAWKAADRAYYGAIGRVETAWIMARQRPGASVDLAMAQFGVAQRAIGDWTRAREALAKAQEEVDAAEELLRKIQGVTGAEGWGGGMGRQV